MKNILKRILIFSITLLLSISNINSFEIVNAITVHKKNTEIEIYEVKEKDEVVISNTIIDFYEKDPNKEEFLEYKAEQERLEQERLKRLAIKEELVSYAKRFIGNPYVRGGNSLTNGTDCSGFVKLIYSKYGYNLPRTTVEQILYGTEVSIEEIEVGDIVSYGYNGRATHSAIYIGDGRIVHASTPEMGIRTDNMYIMPILSIRRVI
ncbi:MAG: C40 family peptidase [Bacilli bacterium]|nr:C40 family peptidase [Bacilli bacterium]